MSLSIFVLNVKDFGALGDGCNDDTAAIQSALDELERMDTTPPEGPCAKAAGDVWAPWPIAVYFPAGVYRIIAPLRPPFARYYRIFGDGGRGGSFFQSGVPVGTVIRQDTDDQSILLFERDQSHSFTIERLGFAWKSAQGPPPAPTQNQPQDPGAVGILFSYTPSGQPPPLPYTAGYFHVLIRECWFRRGWRGIALDDQTNTHSVTLSLWDTQVERCAFEEMSGSAVRLKNATGVAPTGMPANAFRNLFVVNNDLFPNVEPQIEVHAAACVLDGLDLEGSHHAPALRLDGQMNLRNVYLEHVEIQQPYYRLIYLSGAAAVTLEGLNVDGVLNAQGGYGSIIHSESVSLVLSGARGPRGEDQLSGGLALENGDAYVVTGAEDTQVQLVGRPYFPNRPQDVNGYKVHLWSEGLFGSSPGGNVQMEPARAKVTLAGASVAAGAVGTYVVAVPWARQGDVVSLGAPPTLPASVIFSGVVVTDGEVQIRTFNTAAAGSGALLADVSGTWYVTAGNGPHAGDPRYESDY